MSDRSLERPLSLHTPYFVHAPDGGVLYDLGAESHVKVSFEMAECTLRDVDALGTLHLPDAIRTRVREGHAHQVLPGVDIRALCAAVGAVGELDIILPALALWCRDDVSILDHGHLPQGVWHVHVERQVFNHESLHQ